MNRLYIYSFWSLLVMSFLSGIIFLYFRDIYITKELFTLINHSMQPVMLKVHIIVSSIVVFFLGAIFAIHAVPYFLKSKKRRILGIMLMLFALTMSLTGYILQVLSDPSFLSLLGWIHLALGVLFVVLLPIHQFNLFGRGENKK